MSACFVHECWLRFFLLSFMNDIFFYVFQDIANDLNIAPEKMDQTLTNTLMLNLSHGYVQLEVQNAMQFWLAKGVDGFYMRYLEFLKLTPQILYNILEWRSIMDSVASSSTGRKILICSGKFIDLLEQHLNDQHKVEIFTGVFDLMEHELKFQPHVNDHLPQEIDRFTSRQFKKTPAPGMLWSIRSVNSSQLTTTLGDDQAFAAVLFSLMLPGTVNLFNRVEMSVEDYRQNNVVSNHSPIFKGLITSVA